MKKICGDCKYVSVWVKVDYDDGTRHETPKCHACDRNAVWVRKVGKNEKACHLFRERGV